MTTFSIAGSGAGSSGGADPSTVTRTAGGTGRLWVAVLHERSGLGHSGHSVSDDNAGTWTKQGSLDSELADANARHSLSIWTHVTVSADTSSTVITGDAGAGNSRLYLYEINPSASYDWTFVETALDTSGTGDWDGQTSGNTSNISGSDLFVMGFGASRLGAGPTTTTTLTQTQNHTDFGGSQHTYFGCGAVDQAGQAGGVKSTTLTVTGGGSGNSDEGIVGVIVFQDGSSGHTATSTLTIPTPTLSAVGVEEFSAPVTLTLPTPTLSVSASTWEDLSGVGTLTIPVPTLASTGIEEVSAAVTLDLPTPTLAAIGVEEFSAPSALTIPTPTLDVVGTAGDGAIGTAVLTVPTPTLAAVGAVPFIADATLTLPTFTLLAVGTTDAVVEWALAAQEVGSDIASMALTVVPISLPALPSTELVPIGAIIPSEAGMSTKVTLWNQSLSQAVTRSTVSSLSERSVEADKCRLHYDQTRKEVLCMAFWPSTQKHSRLQRLATRDFNVAWEDGDPSPQYKYAYALPSDYLHARYLDDFSSFAIELLEANRKAVMTNAEAPVLTYTYDQTNCDIWDPLLFSAIMEGLASKLSLPIKGKLDHAQSARDRANQAVLTARAIAANQRHEQYDFEAEWISARGGVGGQPTTNFIYPYANLYITSGANVS